MLVFLKRWKIIYDKRRTRTMETIKINGKEYLLDIEQAKSQGLLREKYNRPRSWEEYVNTQPCGVNSTNDVYHIGEYDSFNSLEEAKAFCALGKLIQLRDAWWGDWRPNWEDNEYKYNIEIYFNRIDIAYHANLSYILAFPTAEMRDDFLNTFRDLIEQAKMFL